MNERTFSGSIEYTIDQDVDLIVKSCRFLGKARFIFYNNSTVKFEDCEFSGPVHFEYHGKNSSSIERCIFFGRTKTICHCSSTVKFVGNLCYGSVSFDGNVQVKKAIAIFMVHFECPLRIVKKRAAFWTEKYYLKLILLMLSYLLYSLLQYFLYW